jgi:hypothetical protein
MIGKIITFFVVSKFMNDLTEKFRPSLIGDKAGMQIP